MKVIVSAVSAWFIAQLIKLLLNLVETKKIDLAKMMASGGMPSSHTALVTAATIRVGLTDGFYSTTFAICLIFSMVVMYDATGVRRSVGVQAQKLNQIFEHLYNTGQFNYEQVKEILGHTPLQVAAGIILGIIIGFLV